ncbi:MAG: hypothetical protein KDD48_02305 [Bdellovibrionales bacterium]|nr:hypothetical protein [Bdellovibrionales bacterium]
MKLSNFFEAWDTTDTLFVLLFSLAILVVLYALTLIHNKLRLIENEIQNIRKDQLVISEELEFMANLRKKNAKEPGLAS